MQILKIQIHSRKILALLILTPSKIVHPDNINTCPTWIFKFKLIVIKLKSNFTLHQPHFKCSIAIYG